MLTKNQKNPKRNLEAIKKLVIFHQILKLLEPDFRSQFSGWRSGDRRNLIENDLKDPSFDFLKIQSDFDLLFWFRRYSRLKSGPEGPETYPAPDSGPNISRTRFFPDMRFSPWVRKGLDLFPSKNKNKSVVLFLRKFGKTSIFTIFGTFFKIYVFGHNSRRRTFLNMRFLPEWAHYKSFTWHKKPEWFYDTNGRNIWKIVRKGKFGPVWEPDFGPRFSGWRSEDSHNLTWGI